MAGCCTTGTPAIRDGKLSAALNIDLFRGTQVASIRAGEFDTFPA